MVLQTMLSSAANGSSGPGLARQPSIYSLTLEELQNAINEPGKSFGSMNMEEFIRNLWTAEESQAMAAVMASSTDNNSLARQTSLQRLNSLSLPPALSRKTVEDVWKDIQRQPVADPIDRHHHHQQQQHHFQQQRQATLGEMTLEDFLVRAGLVREDPEASSHLTDGNNAMSLFSGVPSGSVHPAMDALTSPSLSSDWMNFASHHQHQQMLQQAEAAAAAAAAAAAKRGLPPPPLTIPSGNPLYDGIADGTRLGPDSLANSLALSPAVSEYAMHGRKRFTSEVVIEKTMERRQKRMIKNRESAARSRARKQAYTVELEAEVTKLKEENARLQQQQVDPLLLEHRHTEGVEQDEAVARLRSEEEKIFRMLHRELETIDRRVTRVRSRAYGIELIGSHAQGGQVVPPRACRRRGPKRGTRRGRGGRGNVIGHADIAETSLVAADREEASSTHEIGASTCLPFIAKPKYDSDGNVLTEGDMPFDSSSSSGFYTDD